MKAYQKGICLAVAMGMMAGCLTGCGGRSTIRTKEIGAGVSSPEKAAETFVNGMFNGELWLTVVPKEYLEYLEDEYYLTEDQLKEKTSSYVYNENGEAKVTSFEIIEKNDFRDMQDLNEVLSEKGLDKSEEAYELEFDFQTEYDDGEGMNDGCFEYNGKWYSWGAMERIEYVAENADDIITYEKVENWDVKVCSSPEMAAEAFVKGKFEDSSFWFLAVPPEFMEYTNRKYGLTEKETKKKVIDACEKWNEEHEKVHFGDKVRRFYIDSCEYEPFDEESRVLKNLLEDLQSIGIEDVEHVKWYVLRPSFDTVNGYDESNYGYDVDGLKIFETDSGFYSYDAMVYIDIALNDFEVHGSTF